jgi:PKD repeat protein
MTLLKQIVRRALHRDATLGQSFVEFALLFPVLLLIVMLGIDFGRVYLGWVNTQNMARIAANYAANNADAWGVPADATRQARYEELVLNDARAINCDLPDPFPDPIFATGIDMGDPVQVHIDCNFTVLTPVISNILGSSVLVSAESTFPVKAGIVGAVPGGAPPVPAAIAAFAASPTSGTEDLEVQVTNTSANNPTSWRWTFGDGTAAVFAKDPPPHLYQDPGTYEIELLASNSGGSSTATVSITVLAAPTTGPIANFSGSPRSGVTPPGINVAFQDLSTGATTWAWTFGDGGTSSAQNPSHAYNTAGSWDVSLTVTDGLGNSHTETKTDYIVVSDKPCTVPVLIGRRKNQAQGDWNDAGFTTTVNLLPPPPQGGQNYVIGTQTLPGGLANPPGGCTGATITVGP